MENQNLPLFTWNNAYVVERAKTDTTIIDLADWELNVPYWHILFDRTGEPTTHAVECAKRVDPYVYIYRDNEVHFANIVVFTTDEPLSLSQIAEVSEGFPAHDLEMNQR